MISVKILERVVRYLLYATLLITPLLFLKPLYFPYLASKTYTFRLLVGMAFFFWTALMVKSKAHRPSVKNLLVLGLAVLFAGYIITGFTGVDAARSFFSGSERSDGVIQFGVWIVYFLMAVSVFRVKRDWQVALGVLTLAGLISSVYGVINIHAQERVFGTLGNPSFLGAYLLFAIGFTALFLVKSLSPFKEPLAPKTAVPFVALIVFFAVTIMLTETRGAYIGLLASCFIFTVLIHFWPDKTARLKKLIIAMDIAVVALIIFLGFVLTNPDSSIVANNHYLKRIANSVESNSVNERFAEWNVAWKGFKDRPIFGWGAENFGVVSNKYYDYRIGLIDSWFDRPHNQTLQILAEGGITLFAGYVFVFIAAIIFLYRIFKREPVVASVLGATLTAYFAQDFFLFDTFATYIGFFTLLGFVYYLHERLSDNKEQDTRDRQQETNNKQPATGNGQQGTRNEGRGTKVRGAEIVVYVAVLAFIWHTVWIPFRYNPLILQYNAAMAAGEFKEAGKILDKSLAVTSPYLEFDIKKGAGWELAIKALLYSEVKPEDKPAVLSMYKKITAALAKSLTERPYEPQIYFVLGSLYRGGYEQLGQTDDLAKSEEILKKGLAHSSTRIEYVDALSQTLLDEKKMDELEALIQEFVSQIDPEDSYRYLSMGNYYYQLEKLNLAFEEYVKAQERGYTFVDTILDRDYDRYLQAAQATKNFDKAVSIIQSHLEKKGPIASDYFNLAVAYIKLEKMDEARAAYERAMELEPETYGQYEGFFK